MNLHRAALKYMGWCPGFNHISAHVPDTEFVLSYRLIAESVVAFFALLIVVSVVFFPPPPIIVNGQLQVYVTENNAQKAYNDGGFDQNFNYTLFQLVDWGTNYPYFIQEKDESDFSDGAVSITDYEFKTLDEVHSLTSQLNAPNCIDQYTIWLTAQNYTETVNKLYATPEKQARYKNNGYLSTLLGDCKAYDRNYCIRYYVIRSSNYGGFSGDDTGLPGTASEGNLNIIDGVRVEKYDSQDMIWKLFIESGWVFNSEHYPSIEPIYKVRLVRFPADNGLVAKESLGR